MIFSIIFAIIFLGLFIYSIYKILSHKVPVCTPKTVYVKVPGETATITKTATVVTTPAKPLISNVPTTKALESDVSLDLSSVVGTSKEKKQVDERLLDLGTAMED